MFPTVTADQFPNPAEDPKGFERAAEVFVLRIELATCDTVRRFQQILGSLPLTAAFRRTPAWQNVVADPLLAGNFERTQRIEARLKELEAAPTN